MKTDSFARYASVLNGLHGVLALSITISLLQTAAFIPIAFLINDVFNHHLPLKNASGLFASSFAILILYVAQASLAVWNRHVSLTVSKKIIARLRTSLIERLFGLSRGSFISLDHAKVQHGIVHDTERVDIMVNALITVCIPSSIVIAGLVGLLFFLDWRLALTLIPLIVSLLLISRSVGRHSRTLVKKFRTDFESFSGSILRILQAMELISSSSMEKVEAQACIDRVDALRRSSGWMAWFLSAYTKAQESIVLGFGVLVLTIGGWLVIEGRMTVGALMSFYVVLVFLKSHFSLLIPAYTQVLEGSGSLHALNGILPAEEVSPTNIGSVEKKKLALRGPIVFENVAFGYGEIDILRNVTFTLPPANTALVMGPSGSGKSTLCRLLGGFYPTRRGFLTLQGVPLLDIDLDDYRRQTGFVMQDPVFFSGSLAENIAYGTTANASEIEEAARAASIHETISRMPKRYDSIIGERGVFLSGGQRQRLALARAFIRKPSLFIFDEPTNHLDVTIIDRFVTQLRLVQRTAMILIVSHDPRLALLADAVYDIVDGSVQVRHQEKSATPTDAHAERIFL